MNLSRFYCNFFPIFFVLFASNFFYCFIFVLTVKRIYIKKNFLLLLLPIKICVVSFRFFVCGTTERCKKLLCIYMKYIVRKKKWQSIMSTKKNIINTRANLIRMKASTLCLTLRKIRKPNEIETGEPTILTVAKYWNRIRTIYAYDGAIWLCLLVRFDCMIHRHKFKTIGTNPDTPILILSSAIHLQCLMNLATVSSEMDKMVDEWAWIQRTYYKYRRR